MKFQKLIAVMCTAACLSTATASAAGMKYLNASNFKNQIDFLLNRGKADVTYDMNCDHVINAFDLVLMKQIEANKKARYVNNIFEKVSVEKDIVFAQKTDYQNNNVDLALDLYQPESDNYEYRPAVILVHGGGMYTGSKDSEWDPVAWYCK